MKKLFLSVAILSLSCSFSYSQTEKKVNKSVVIAYNFTKITNKNLNSSNGLYSQIKYFELQENAAEWKTQRGKKKNIPIFIIAGVLIAAAIFIR